MPKLNYGFKGETAFTLTQALAAGAAVSSADYGYFVQLGGITPVSGFEPMAVLLTSGSTYSPPAGATSMKAWAVGGGGGTRGGGGVGGAGGTAFKTWSVSGGSSVSYGVGAAGGMGMSFGPGGDTTVTYGGTTITGGGGGYAGSSGYSGAFTIGEGGTHSGGDGGADGGAGTRPSGECGGAVGGNSQPILMCPGYDYQGRRPATDVSGLLEAVALAGGVATPVCSDTGSFGSGSHGMEKFSSGRPAGLGGGGSAGGNPGGGAVVLYFT